MARIRTVKPEFWTSEQVVECSRDARLMFIGLWNFCDDSGRMEESARQIKMKVFPGDDLTLESIHGMLRELSENGLIIRYGVGNKRYLQVTGWHHQKISHPAKSNIPPPEDGCVDDPPESSRAFHTEGMVWDGIGGDGKGSTHQETLEKNPDARNVDAGDLIEVVRESILARWGANGGAWTPSAKGSEKPQQWLEAGMTPEWLKAVIDPALERHFNSRGGMPKSFNWFDRAVQEALERQWSDDAQSGVKAEDRELIQWRSRVKGYWQDGTWLATWGPKPDEPGCWAPSEVLEQERGEAA